VWLREEQIRTVIDLLRVFVRDVATPLSGMVLMGYLVATPGERSSYFVVAGGLITAPFALAANARRIASKDAAAEPAKEDA
jgi:hypothetical protein